MKQEQLCLPGVKPITVRQQRVLDYIVAFRKTWGFSPTVREIAHATGVVSSSTIQSHVNKLVAKGYVRKLSDTPRTLMPVNGTACPLCGHAA